MSYSLFFAILFSAAGGFLYLDGYKAIKKNLSPSLAVAEESLEAGDCLEMKNEIDKDFFYSLEVKNAKGFKARKVQWSYDEEKILNYPLLANIDIDQKAPYFKKISCPNDYLKIKIIPGKSYQLKDFAKFKTGDCPMREGEELLVLEIMPDDYRVKMSGKEEAVFLQSIITTDRLYQKAECSAQNDEP